MRAVNVGREHVKRTVLEGILGCQRSAREDQVLRFCKAK